MCGVAFQCGTDCEQCIGTSRTLIQSCYRKQRHCQDAGRCPTLIAQRERPARPVPATAVPVLQSEPDRARSGDRRATQPGLPDRGERDRLSDGRKYALPGLCRNRRRGSRQGRERLVGEARMTPSAIWSCLRAQVDNPRADRCPQYIRTSRHRLQRTPQESARASSAGFARPVARETTTGDGDVQEIPMAEPEEVFDHISEPRPFGSQSRVLSLLELRVEHDWKRDTADRQPQRPIGSRENHHTRHFFIAEGANRCRWRAGRGSTLTSQQISGVGAPCSHIQWSSTGRPQRSWSGSHGEAGRS